MPLIVNVVMEATGCPRLPILGPVYIYDSNANTTSVRISEYAYRWKLMTSQCLLVVIKVRDIRCENDDDDESNECHDKYGRHSGSNT
jgi:hypothetical protein